MRFLYAVLNIQQELSIVFHQDWRQLLAHARGAVGERNVVYFYSNGSATANRGAEVSDCGIVRYAVFRFNMCQVIHQLHRAVLDCGIESYIEKVAWSEFSCLTSHPPYSRISPTATP